MTLYRPVGTAEELAGFNRHIVREIEVIREFAGDGRGERE